jgi:uncharacterized repeat protein (TIGR01451 family)
MTVLLVVLAHGLLPGLTQTSVAIFPTNPSLRFQTTGQDRLPTIGDWYTSTATASTDRVHRFFVNITEADIAAGGGSVRIGIRDGQSNGEIDELDNGRSLTNSSVDDRTCPRGPTSVLPEPFCDPTRFTLRDSSGIELDSRVIPSNTAPGNLFAFAAVTTPGVYIVTSETGGRPISGDNTSNRNDDDNSFEILVTSDPADPPLIGLTQATFQRAESTGANLDIPFYFLVGPDVDSLFLRNFDLDQQFNAAVSLEYFSPSAPTTAIPGTASTQAVWNGGGDLNTGGDTVPIPDRIAGSGFWQLDINNYNVDNQTIIEANTGDGRRLVVFDTPPQRAGNFTVVHNRPPVRVQGALCYDIEIANLFFTADIINLNIPTPPRGYTFRLFDGDRTTPLVDTDGDGNLDTGVLPELTGRRTIALCATPAADAPRDVTVQIQASSFMNRRVRQQSGLQGAAPITLNKRIQLDDGPPGAFRIVKRIANVVRNGSVLPNVDFNQVIDDPSSSEDNAPGWSQIRLAGITELPLTNPVQGRDEVTYRVYFLSDGGSPVRDVRICDLIPGGMTFLPETIRIKIGNGPLRPIGNFYSPLAPLPANNSCILQENPNGAVITELGIVSSNPGQNVGFIEFQVRVN